MSSLRVENLSVSIENKLVLRDVSFELKRGEIISIMGPNGSGKTSLALAIMGHPKYEILSGRILLDDEEITHLSPDERSLRGLFLAFQNPIEVKGIRLSTLIFSALNKRRGERNLLKSDPKIIPLLMQNLREVGLSNDHLHRDVNLGFSGGEKKRAELLQALMLKPKFLILDEPDSGLDVDGIKITAKKIKELASQGTGIIIITHYARLLKYLSPKEIIVISDGKIIARGGSELSYLIEERGYEALKGDLNA